MKILSLTAVMLLTMLSLSWGQDKPQTVDELAAYTAPDREQILLEGARAEGKVVWYTSFGGWFIQGNRQSVSRKVPAGRH